MITKKMIIADVLEMNPGTADVFVSNGMHCIGCPVSRGESIEEASAVHGLDADKLVDALNAFLDSQK